MKNNDSTAENIEENSKKTAKVSTRKSIKLDKSKEIQLKSQDFLRLSKSVSESEIQRISQNSSKPSIIHKKHELFPQFGFFPEDSVIQKIQELKLIGKKLQLVNEQIKNTIRDLSGFITVQLPKIMNAFQQNIQEQCQRIIKGFSSQRQIAYLNLKLDSPRVERPQINTEQFDGIVRNYIKSVQNLSRKIFLKTKSSRINENPKLIKSNQKSMTKDLDQKAKAIRKGQNKFLKKNLF